MAEFIAQDGCRIHYDTFGTRGPCLLLLPGLGGDGRFWGGVVDLLRSDHRLIVMDHRGAGRSARPDGPYSIPGIAADVAGLIAQQDGPVHLVGHSTGGAVAQELAIAAPTRLASVTISASWARADARFRAIFQARAMVLEAGLTEAYQMLTDVFGHLPADIAANEAQMIEGRGDAAARLAPLAVTVARLRMLLAHDTLARLPNVRLPSLVLAARDDILVPPEMSRLIADAIPGARLQTLPGAHFHPQADPSPMAQALRAFLQGIG